MKRSPSACACGGGCPRCRPGQSLKSKLEVSQPGDALEQEAEQVAELVMHTSQPDSPVGMKTNEEAGPRISRYSTGAATPRPQGVPPVAHEVSHQHPGTDDHAYEDVPAYAGLSPADAIDNAASYATAGRQIYHGGAHGPGETCPP